MTVNDVYESFKQMIELLVPVTVLGLGIIFSVSVFIGITRLASKLLKPDSPEYTPNPKTEEARRIEAERRAQYWHEEEQRKEALRRQKHTVRANIHRTKRQGKPVGTSILVNAIAFGKYIRASLRPDACPKCGGPNRDHAAVCPYCGNHF